MNDVISELKAMEIVREFVAEIHNIDKGILAVYVIGSLGGNYYRPGQSDIDTVIIVSDDAFITQKQMDRIADRYRQKYNIPKGFGSVMIHEHELLPPYTNSETDEFEFTIEIARLKTQGKPVYGSIEIDTIQMPTTDHFVKDALIMERWFNKEFGYPMFDKLQITGCVNTVLGILRRYLIIEKGIFEFNKYKTIDAYLKNTPPIINNAAFNFIKRKLHDDIDGTEEDLLMLRACGIEFRDYFNRRLLGIDSRTP